MIKNFNINTFLNRNLLIIIFVGLVLGIVIFLTIEYDRNLRENREYEQSFLLKQEDEKKKEEESKISDITPENIESKITIDATAESDLDRTFGEEVYSEPASGELINKVYYDRNTNREYFVTVDPSGKVKLYQYEPPVEKQDFRSYVESIGVESWDFYMIPKSPDDSEHVMYVNLNRRIAIDTLGNRILRIWRFANYNRADFIRYFGQGRIVLDQL